MCLHSGFSYGMLLILLFSFILQSEICVKLKKENGNEN